VSARPGALFEKQAAKSAEIVVQPPARREVGLQLRERVGGQLESLLAPLRTLRPARAISESTSVRASTIMLIRRSTNS